ncbi:hypothetical protein [Desulfonema limicola]|nr:hypothetical protein [Desulfonema limicola]
MKRIIIVLFLFIFSMNSYADIIYFKNGKVANVQQAWEEGDYIKCIRFGGVVSYKKELIQSISSGVTDEMRSAQDEINKAIEQKKLEEERKNIYPENYKQEISSYLKTALYDYDSMKNLNIEEPKLSTMAAGNKLWTVNIYYNAKNRYGAYTGLKKHRIYFMYGKLSHTSD